MTTIETRTTTLPAEPDTMPPEVGTPPVTVQPEVAGSPLPPPRRRLTRFSKIALSLIAVLALLETSGLAVRYVLTDRLYVISDNAQVDGTQIAINAPADGVVTDWRLSTGSTVSDNQVVGRIEKQGNTYRPKMPIRSPGVGTVARTSVTDGVYVTAGSRLAVLYDQDGVYVTARVEEDSVDAVRVGAPVTVHVDAASGQPVTGVVASVGAAAAGVYELDGNGNPLDHNRPIYPGPNTDPRNPQKVDQYVPVRINLTDTGAAWITPGMNVTVDIRRP